MLFLKDLQQRGVMLLIASVVYQQVVYGSAVDFLPALASSAAMRNAAVLVCLAVLLVEGRHHRRLAHPQSFILPS